MEIHSLLTISMIFVFINFFFSSIFILSFVGSYPLTYLFFVFLSIHHIFVYVVRSDQLSFELKSTYSFGTSRDEVIDRAATSDARAFSREHCATM